MNAEATKHKYFPYFLEVIRNKNQQQLLESLKISYMKSEYDNLPDIELTKSELKELFPYLNKKVIEEGRLNYYGVEISEKKDEELISQDNKEIVFLNSKPDLNQSKYNFKLNIRKFVISLLNSNSTPKGDSKENLNDEVNLIWEMYDLDKDDRIEIFELEALLTNFNLMNYLYFDKFTIKEIAILIFEKLDENQNGYITKEQFRNHINENKDNNLISHIFQKPKGKEKHVDEYEDVIRDCKAYFIIKFKIIFWTTIYILSNLFWASYFFYISYKPGFIELAIAKFFAGLILWNMPLLLLFACENFFTLFSNTFVYSILPLDNLKHYHKICAYGFIFGSIGHTITHLLGTYTKIVTLNIEEVNKFLLTKFDHPVDYFYLTFQTLYGLTGILMMLILLIMFITTLKVVITKKFEVFWYVHKLYYLIFILTFLHGLGRLVADPVYWKFIIGPASIFLIEVFIDIYRFFCYKTKIISVKMIDQEVIELILTKPRCFNNKAGQYSNINIPEISSLQFHPFTIASATHHTNLVFYISQLGNWTNKLARIAKKFKENPVVETKLESPKMDFNSLKKQTNILFYDQKPILNVMKKPYCRIDGPLGAPCERFANYKNLIFIGGGIGITPFASILFTLLHEIKNGNKLNFMNIQLIWVVRKFSNVIWMINLIKRILAEDTNRIFTISLYLTEKTKDLRSFLLWHGLELLRRERREKLSHYCENIFWGRPKFDEILNKSKIEMQYLNIKQEVGVFVCANYYICKDVLNSCLKNSESEITFKFNKENF